MTIGGSADRFFTAGECLLIQVKPYKCPVFRKEREDCCSMTAQPHSSVQINTVPLDIQVIDCFLE